jgi:predicted nucleotidyltransferase
MKRVIEKRAVDEIIGQMLENQTNVLITAGMLTGYMLCKNYPKDDIVLYIGAIHNLIKDVNSLDDEIKETFVTMHLCIMDRFYMEYDISEIGSFKCYEKEKDV